MMARARLSLPVLAALACLALPGGAAARCVPFNLLEDVGEVPVVILGRVTSSNADTLGDGRCLTVACTYTAQIEVIEVLKGEVAQKSVSMSYEYLDQRPEITVYPAGTTVIFALASVSEAGVAAPYGTTCGRSGMALDALDQVRGAIAGAR